MAALSEGSLKRDANGSCVHHRSENPCQELLERPALNEKITAITTGSTDHAR